MSFSVYDMNVIIANTSVVEQFYMEKFRIHFHQNKFTETHYLPFTSTTIYIQYCIMKP